MNPRKNPLKNPMKNLSAVTGLWAAVFLPWGDYVAKKGLPKDRLKTQVRVAPTSTCDSGPVFNTLIAATNATRAKGYGGRKKPLNKTESMLFVYPAPEVMSFWMKDVSVPLAIGFYDVKGNLVRRHLMPAESDPAHPTLIYSSNFPAQTALEAAPDTIPENGVLCMKAK